MLRDEKRMRLKVHASPLIKFCISINRGRYLSDLVQMISGILKTDYQWTGHGFRVVTADGFEILSLYPLAEVLEDRETVYLDMVVSTMRNKNISQTKRIQSIVPTEAHPDRSVKSHTRPSSHMSTSSSPASSVGGQQPGQQATDRHRKRENDWLATERERVDDTEGAVADSLGRVANAANMPATLLSGSEIYAAAQAAEAAASPDSRQGGGAALESGDVSEAPARPVPIFSTKFKGFAVHKTDLVGTDEPGSTAASEYKPLKRKRGQESFEPI